MLSLRGLILQTPANTADLLDRKPSNSMVANPEDFNSSVLISKQDLFLQYFNSNRQSKILYALSNFSKVAKKDSSVISLLPKICDLLFHSSQIIEYAAVTCLQNTASLFARQVIKDCYDDIILRFQQFPTQEYVDLLTKLYPFLSQDCIKLKLLPLINSFLDKDESYQYAACGLLQNFPFNLITLTSDIYAHFLSSQILVYHYLSSISNRIIQIMGDSWACSSMVAMILSLANSNDHARPACVKTIVSNTTNYNERNIYSFMLSAFSWANSSENVAIELLENCDLIIKQKRGEFYSKLLSLTSKLMQSNNANIRIRLIIAIANNQALLSGNDTHIKNILKLATEDPSPEVRATLLKNFCQISSLSTSFNIKEFLFESFAALMNDQNPHVRALIPQSPYFAQLGVQRLQHLAPTFIRFLSQIDHQWRQFAAAIRTFCGFPDEVISYSLQTVLPVINSAAAKNRYALTNTLIGFFAKASRAARDDQIDWLVNQVTKFYGRSKNYQMRSFFPELVLVLGYAVSPEKFERELWPPLIATASDPVDSVRQHFAKSSGKLRSFFRSLCDDRKEKSVADAVEKMADDASPMVREEAKNHTGEYATRYSLEDSSPLPQGSTLPNLVKRKTRAVNSGSLSYNPPVSPASQPGTRPGRMRTKSLSMKGSMQKKVPLFGVYSASKLNV